MESIVRDVTALDEMHRRALEDVIGRQLQANQRLIIRVADIDVESPAEAGGVRRRQSLDDWKRIYEGLSSDEIDAIDQIAKTRADLSRRLP
jgi:hypothetical protein